MANYVDVHFQALEECGKRAHKVAKMLSLDDAFQNTESRAPTRPTATSIFGHLADSGALADAVDQVWDGLRTDLSDGESRLGSVEKAIDEVEKNLRAASKASGG